MPVQNVYLKIESIPDYSPVAPDEEVSPPVAYRRDCMRNAGHEDGTIPKDEVEARSLNALVYREYLDPGFVIPKPDKIVLTDVNEPAFDRRVPGAVVYTSPGNWLRITVRNGDDVPHSFHLHGLCCGIDSDGAWPFGTKGGGGRSDEICPGQTWTYAFEVTDKMYGAWPFHDHCRDITKYVNRGLFGAVIVMPAKECAAIPRFELASGLQELLRNELAQPRAARRGPADDALDNAVAAHLAVIDEAVRAPHLQPVPDPTRPLYVPLFIHAMSEDRRGATASLCFNGRSFVGNTPTVLAAAGQKIRWYVLNLDLGGRWHNFHPHAQRWQFAGETIDVRSLGPAESFLAETVAPAPLLLPPEILQAQRPDYRPPEAKPFNLRGDFLFHCHSIPDMEQGLAGLVRSTQTVWLTPEQAAMIEAGIGLPLDPGDNLCPDVDFDRCKNAQAGKWEELPGQPGVVFMHAVLLPKTKSVLFWGYGPRPDQTRVWDQATGLYSPPANQPADLSPDQNLWSGTHAVLDDAAATVLATGGMGGGDTERRAFLFDPPSRTFSRATELNIGRFYTTTVTLDDGRPMVLFGTDDGGGTGVAASFEVFTPGGPGSWSAPTPLPFNYMFYPWTFLLPGGDLFIAGPQKPARRFNRTALPIVDDPARQFNQVFSQRGVNMDGTALLLPLRPPNYAPRVLIAGGSTADTRQSAEWIDLSAAAPAWQALANLSVPRDKLNSVLLPDGRVVIVGGQVAGLADGGPVEIFDPEDMAAGFRPGPSMKFQRDYHSAAILLPDGSVLVGGDPRDPAGNPTPHERYLPPYFFTARPAITGAPANIGYGGSFNVNTPQAADIDRVVLMRPGAVTHAFNMAQRYVGCAVVGAGGNSVQATAPPDGNVAPPGHYLLFVVNGERVPSEGVWVKLG